MAPTASRLLEVHGFIVLIHDFASEDFFQDIFQAHDSRDGPPFIHDAHDVAALFEEAEQEFF